jgi:ribose/xylose/arabinose/galactoside ABC-type transport system permease subunit
MRTLSVAARHRVVAILLATLLAGILLVPGFASPITASLALDRAASIGLLAIGLTVLLAAGQIDLSGGAVFALSGIVAVALQPSLGIAASSIIGVGVGLGAGLVNGLIVVGLGINSLVATLATLLAFRALSHWLTESQPLSGIDIMFSLTISQVFLGLMTIRAALFLVLVVLLHLWLTRAVAGRHILALGSSPAAATASGLRAGWMTVTAFAFAGLLAGVAGVLQSLSVNTGSPVFGSELTILALTAVVVGGTRLEGGRASGLGTLGGVLTLAALTTAMEFQSVPAYVQEIVTGAILLVLVVLDRIAAPRTVMP